MIETMYPNLNHHQWQLVFDAVRKQQVNSIVDGSTYKQYDAILNELWEVSYSDTYDALKNMAPEDKR